MPNFSNKSKCWHMSVCDEPDNIQSYMDQAVSNNNNNACALQLWTNILISGVTLCCNLAESVGSREHCDFEIPGMRYIQKKKCISFNLFSIILRILQLHITLEPLVRFRWVSCTPPNEDFNQIEKCDMFNFRLKLRSFYFI